MTDKATNLAIPPDGYSDWLGELMHRIHSAQQRAALEVNRELVLLYWEVGQDILTLLAVQGWGKKVVNRLATDLRSAFPDMKEFSPRNLKYTRSFAEAWPDAEFVQQVAAQLPFKLRWNVLTELKAGKFKPENLGQLGFYMTAINAQIKHPQDSPTIGLLLSKSKNKVVAEYALRDKAQPIGVAEYRLVESLPPELQTNMPSTEQFERELAEHASPTNGFEQ